MAECASLLAAGRLFDFCHVSQTNHEEMRSIFEWGVRAMSGEKGLKTLFSERYVYAIMNHKNSDRENDKEAQRRG